MKEWALLILVAACLVGAYYLGQMWVRHYDSQHRGEPVPEMCIGRPC